MKLIRPIRMIHTSDIDDGYRPHSQCDRDMHMVCLLHQGCSSCNHNTLMAVDVPSIRSSSPCLLFEPGQHSRIMIDTEYPCHANALRSQGPHAGHCGVDKQHILACGAVCDAQGRGPAAHRQQPDAAGGPCCGRQERTPSQQCCMLQHRVCQDFTVLWRHVLLMPQY